MGLGRLGRGLGVGLVRGLEEEALDHELAELCDVRVWVGVLGPRGDGHAIRLVEERMDGQVHTQTGRHTARICKKGKQRTRYRQVRGVENAHRTDIHRHTHREKETRSPDRTWRQSRGSQRVHTPHARTR